MGINYICIHSILCVLTGTVHFVFMETVGVFAKHANLFIKWPKQEEFEQIAQGFNLPRVTGTSLYFVVLGLIIT